MTVTSPLDTALAYANQDLGVVPLWGVDALGDCACGGSELCHPGKHPIGRLAPRGHHSASTNTDEITDWFTKFPEANVGLELEKSGLLATDVDYRAGGEEGDYSLVQQHGAWPLSWMHQTGNGWHQLFVRPVGGSIRSLKLAPGVDLMISGYVVAPPSIHTSGTSYVWDVDADPLAGHLLAQVPDWLIEEINRVEADPMLGQRVRKLDCEVRRLIQPSARLTNRILTDIKVAKAWTRQYPSEIRTDDSDSAWTFSLALLLYWRHFSDQEVVDAMVCYRDHIQAKQKPDSWFLRSCSRAKSNYLNQLHRYTQASAS